MALKTSTVRLEYTPIEISEFIKEELIRSREATKNDNISIDYKIEEVGGDDRMGYRGNDIVTKIIVTIEKAK